MKKIIQLALTLSLIAITANATAASKEQRFPHECTAQGYQLTPYSVTFTPTAKYHPQALYFVKNISNKNVNLLQTRTGDEDYVNYLQNTIKPNLWSSLALDEPETTFICTTTNNRTGKPFAIDCSKVLDICEFTRVRFGENHRGNYWISHNKSMRATFNSTKWHGVLMVDPKRK